ncbi:Retrovirus-related Pol polyprotein from transposon 17.6 [Araneus ventricosus]|uniref:Retrovirus-related Pol polyprotein from transposon 17.6 n=1 Tax=Araneus ventricosus TaxID=182803 RepID=A0A4Y2UB47_ARAVE|nr:Retrovirus-related Pol polyprotein from transposon 17.6 [Araneus ventricosus]
MKEETAATVNSVKRNRRQNQPKQSSQEYECKKCGRKHKPRECPAYGKVCTKCNKKNHFATKCFQNSKNIHEMKVPENELDIYIDSVTEKVQGNELNSDSMNKNVEIVSETWYKSVTLNANDKYFEVDFKLVTGSEVNIPLYVLNIVKVKPKLSETNLSLTAYGNFKLKPEGTIIINCSTSKLKNIPLQFYAVNVKSKPILGLKGCLELKLIERIDAIECSKISKNELIKQYKDVFTGTGEFPDEPYHITLKDNAIPVIHPPRRVPQALQPKLKESLDKLERIVSKVNKPTDWVQSLVIVEKPNGNLRLCLDLRDLNKVIKREHYEIPSADDIISRLEGNDEASHDAIMSMVLERARSVNIKFNPDKLQYRVSEVKYVGQIISKSGIKPDPDHIKAIVEMPTPKSKTEIRRLLGMINFLSKFIPNVSKVTAPLREIIHENVEFNWGKEQEMPFENIKELLTKTPILKVFSANDEIVIQCDSSKDGLGSCLIQKGQPVSFVSRSLTKSEKNYAQIEKELLAIVFSFEKYHNFIYGHKVIVQSDHRPLMAIVKKPMHKISSRMQRMVLKLLKYDFEINYVLGNQMFLADTLSCAFPVNQTVNDDPEMLNIVHTISKHLPISDYVV